MAGYRHSRPDRAKAAAAAIAVHALIGAAFLTGLVTTVGREPERGMKTFDVPPELPPALDEPVEKAESAPEGEAAPPNFKADPTPMVAPEPKLAAPTPIAAAPIAGTGSASSAGAAEVPGPGTGAGGSGFGRGGGGSGGEGSGIGSPARLLGGNRARLPRHLLRAFAQERGYAHLLLTISAAGRVTDCSVLQGTGNAAVDEELCAIMVRRSQWVPARDTQGRPITVQVRYTSTWSKN